MNTCCLCGSEETWECLTCGEVFCETHWHFTSEGTNVECTDCERAREETESTAYQLTTT